MARDAIVDPVREANNVLDHPSKRARSADNEHGTTAGGIFNQVSSPENSLHTAGGSSQTPDDVGAYSDSMDLDDDTMSTHLEDESVSSLSPQAVSAINKAPPTTTLLQFMQNQPGGLEQFRSGKPAELPTGDSPSASLSKQAASRQGSADPEQDIMETAGESQVPTDSNAIGGTSPSIGTNYSSSVSSASVPLGKASRAKSILERILFTQKSKDSSEQQQSVVENPENESATTSDLESDEEKEEEGDMDVDEDDVLVPAHAQSTGPVGKSQPSALKQSRFASDNLQHTQPGKASGNASSRVSLARKTAPGNKSPVSDASGSEYGSDEEYLESVEHDAPQPAAPRRSTRAQRAWFAEQEAEFPADERDFRGPSLLSVANTVGSTKKQVPKGLFWHLWKPASSSEQPKDAFDASDVEAVENNSGGVEAARQEEDRATPVEEEATTGTDEASAIENGMLQAGEAALRRASLRSQNPVESTVQRRLENWQFLRWNPSPRLEIHPSPSLLQSQTLVWVALLARLRT